MNATALKNSPKADDKNASTFKVVKGGETTANGTEIANSAMMEKFKPQPLTAEERIKRFNQFGAVKNRFEILNQKRENLKMWDAGNDRSTAQIILKNSSGFEFGVTNTFVIQKVRDVLEKELEILLYEVENEISTFEI